MRILFQDLRFSYREWSKRPGLALTAIMSLALGIGRQRRFSASFTPCLSILTHTALQTA